MDAVVETSKTVDPDFSVLMAEYQQQKAKTEEKAARLYGETRSVSDIPGLGMHHISDKAPFQSASNTSRLAPRQ